MRIEPFGVEQWMNAHETQCALNLAETCVHSLSIAELLALAGKNERDLSAVLPMRMTYGDIEGSPRLRTAIAALYAGQVPDNVVVTHGTIGANALVHAALVERGDRVVSIVPTYQRHTAIPASLGAEVVELRLRAEDGFLPDLGVLAQMAKGARLIALTNPNNPTGALMGRGMLERVVEIARAAGAWVLCDEVYRGTEQEGDAVTPSITDLYERGISTAGMSKAFSLAGLRLGWVCGPREVIDAVNLHRDYTTISVGMLDDHFATMALEAAPQVLARSRGIVRRNLAILDDWVQATPGVRHVRPRAGTTSMLAYGREMGSRAFCQRLLADTGVLFVPGEVFGMEGYVRVGYACETDVLAAGAGNSGGVAGRSSALTGFFAGAVPSEEARQG
ncbi:MAG: aminotransferase class I/II-fold pyridoxal phosphate-dependent enzyme [Gemmobacter sp.]